MSRLDASFILPVNNPDLLHRLESNLAQHFTGHQVIPIEGATSFFDAWRQGLPQVKNKYVILTHQDVMLSKIPPLDSLFEGKTGMVGVAGSTVIDRKYPWWFERGVLSGQLSGSIRHGWIGRLGIPGYLGPRREVVVLDGVCLITPTEILKKVGIPTEDWAAWHFYDHILSLKYREKGFTLKTVPIGIVHDSTGDNTSEQFRQVKEQFVEEYFKDQESYRVI